MKMWIIFKSRTLLMFGCSIHMRSCWTHLHFWIFSWKWRSWLTTRQSLWLSKLYDTWESLKFILTMKMWMMFRKGVRNVHFRYECLKRWHSYDFFWRKDRDRKGIMTFCVIFKVESDNDVSCKNETERWNAAIVRV